MDFTILFRAAVAASVRRGRRTLQVAPIKLYRFRGRMISAATYFERSETTPQSRFTPSQLSYRGAKKQANEIAPTVCKMRIT